LPEVGIGVKKSHLYDIRGLRVIVDEAVDEPIERFLVALDQCLEILPPPAKRAANECRIVHCRGALHLVRGRQRAGVPFPWGNDRA
jgi:hypothetical protein